MLEDLNKVIASVEDLHALAQEAKENTRPTDHSAEQERLQGSLERVRRLRKSAYEDYEDHVEITYNFTDDLGLLGKD